MDMITGSALTPLRESVSALLAYKARDPVNLPVGSTIQRSVGGHILL
jgi:hypothetical protein